MNTFRICLSTALLLVSLIGCGSDSNLPEQIEDNPLRPVDRPEPAEAEAKAARQQAPGDAQPETAIQVPEARARVVVSQSTPEEAFDTYASAVSGRDWKAEFVCLNEQSQLSVLTWAFSLASYEHVIDAPAFARKYPVDWGLCLAATTGATPQYMRAPVEKIEDLPAFYDDLMQWLETLLPKASSRGPFLKAKGWQDVEFTRADVAGETATVYAKGPSLDRTKMELKAFVLENADGNWLIDLRKSEEATRQYQQAAVQVSAEQLNSFEFTTDVMQVAFSSDSKWLGVAADRELSVWNVETGEKVWAIDEKDGWIASLDFSHDDKTIAVGLASSSTREHPFIKLYDAKNGQEIKSLGKHEGIIGFLSFRSNDEELVTGGDDGAVHVWNVAEGSKLRSIMFGSKGVAHAFAISPDTKRIATTEPSRPVYIWDLGSGEQLLILENSQPTKFDFTPDGRHVITLDGYFESNPLKITKWDSKSGEEVSAWELQRVTFVYSMAISPNGKDLATGVGDWHVKLWDLSTGKETATLTGHKGFVRFISFSPGGTILASVDVEKTVKLWAVGRQE